MSCLYKWWKSLDDIYIWGGIVINTWEKLSKSRKYPCKTIEVYYQDVV